VLGSAIERLDDAGHPRTDWRGRYGNDDGRSPVTARRTEQARASASGSERRWSGGRPEPGAAAARTMRATAVAGLANGRRPNPQPSAPPSSRLKLSPPGDPAATRLRAIPRRENTGTFTNPRQNANAAAAASVPATTKAGKGGHCNSATANRRSDRDIGNGRRRKPEAWRRTPQAPALTNGVERCLAPEHRGQQRPGFSAPRFQASFHICRPPGRRVQKASRQRPMMTPDVVKRPMRQHSELGTAARCPSSKTLRENRR